MVNLNWLLHQKLKILTTCSSSALELSSGMVSGKIVSFGEDNHGSSSVLACLDGASDCETDTFWLGGLLVPPVPSSFENLPEIIVEFIFTVFS